MQRRIQNSVEHLRQSFLWNFRKNFHLRCLTTVLDKTLVKFFKF